MNDFSVMMVHRKHRILKDLFYMIFDGKERAMCVREKENWRKMLFSNKNAHKGLKQIFPTVEVKTNVMHFL